MYVRTLIKLSPLSFLLELILSTDRRICTQTCKLAINDSDNYNFYTIDNQTGDGKELLFGKHLFYGRMLLIEWAFNSSISSL